MRLNYALNQESVHFMNNPGISILRREINLKDTLPENAGKIHGNRRSDLEDLAFSSRPPREADEIGRP